MFETNHMWLVKSLVRKTNIIKNVTVTTLKNEQLKASRNVTKLTRKAFLSFCFPCSFTIHVNSKLMRTIFYSHNKFTNYIFHNSPDILCFSKVKKLNLKGNSVERNRLSPLVPSNSVEYSGIRRTGSTNFSNVLKIIFFSLNHS